MKLRNYLIRASILKKIRQDHNQYRMKENFIVDLTSINQDFSIGFMLKSTKLINLKRELKKSLHDIVIKLVN